MDDECGEPVIVYKDLIISTIVDRRITKILAILSIRT